MKDPFKETRGDSKAEDRKLVIVGFIDRNGKAVVTKSRSSKCFESCTCKPTCKELIDGN